MKQKKNLTCVSDDTFSEVIGQASARFYKIGNNWFVGNAVFLETALRIFLIFCIKLGDYKGTKVTKPDF